MKLNELFAGLFEARKNPDQNPKLSDVEQLRKYKDDPDIFISYTDIPKIGMNPKYNFDTPMGVYFYPLQSFWNHFKSDFEAGRMPKSFATSRRYIQIIKSKQRGKQIRDTRTYTEADRKRDFDGLRKLGYDVDNAFKNIPDNMYTESEFGKFWNTINVLTSHITGWDKLGTNKLALAKNKILRKLGYTFMSEIGGTGIIHPNEVSQGFFTSGDNIQLIDVIDRERWKGSPLTTSPDILNTKKWNPDLIDKLRPYLQEIRRDPDKAVAYAKLVLIGRWKQAEPFIMQTNNVITYAKEILAKDPDWPYPSGRWPEAEPTIMKNPMTAMAYARDILAKEPDWPFPSGRWKEAEPYIMKDPDAAYHYAAFILDSTWPEAEPYIMKNADQAFDYALMVMNKDTQDHPIRWKEAEPYIMKDPSTAVAYAQWILKHRWDNPKAEDYIKTDAQSWDHYKAMFSIK